MSSSVAAGQCGRPGPTTRPCPGWRDSLPQVSPTSPLCSRSSAPTCGYSNTRDAALDEELVGYQARDLYDATAPTSNGVRLIVHRAGGRPIGALRGLAQAVIAHPKVDPGRVDRLSPFNPFSHLDGQRRGCRSHAQPGARLPRRTRWRLSPNRTRNCRGCRGTGSRGSNAGERSHFVVFTSPG